MRVGLVPEREIAQRSLDLCRTELEAIGLARTNPVVLDLLLERTSVTSAGYLRLLHATEDLR